MRFSEIVESAEDQTAIILIERSIKAINKYLLEFNTITAIYGFEQASKIMNDAISELDNANWYLAFLISETKNSKVKRHLSKLEKVKQQAKDRINSGL